MIALLLQFIALIAYTNGDVYLHNPRGSNNRLDEKGRARSNANRLFDSQNNDRGGYNVGNLYYYAGSKLDIEWTNQHSCAGPNNNCEMVVQYMCGENVRDGIQTSTIPDNRAKCQNYNCDRDLRYGMHEDYNYYKHCVLRQRNNYFTADQKLKGNSARYTRQNPQGTRRGYECPEEKDTYPYHQPTPWKDIVIMTNDINKCEMYRTESQNVKARYACIPPPEYYTDGKRGRYRIPITETECNDFCWPIGDQNCKPSIWKEFPSHGIPEPECRETMASRDNHLGNGIGKSKANTYEWMLPNEDLKHCVLRIRYNISTNDYESWPQPTENSQPTSTDDDIVPDIASLVGLSDQVAKERGYVFENNPVVDLFGPLNNGKKIKLRLAINTAQFGRTFQDRSHTFDIRPRPASLQGAKIHNLNVRGKRGNIVQVYPAVEYDFVPNVLTLSADDYVHFQWTGSNTNPSNNDGQGLRGTDRSNAVLLKSKNGVPESEQDPLINGHWGNSYPMHLSKVNFLGLSQNDLINLALVRPGQFGGEMSELDDAGTYFDLGARKVTAADAGTYFFMSTRNNNFSNRSQKGKIIVRTNPTGFAQMGWDGGEILLDSEGEKALVVADDTLNGAKDLTFEEWSTARAEEYAKSQGGSMKEGDGYASNYFVLFPAEDLTKTGKTMTLKMTVDSDSISDVTLFHSYDTKTWSRMNGVSFEDGVASMQTTKGGFYVARKETKYGVVAGIVVACLVLLVIIIGTTIYCRKKPERWSNFKRRTRNVHRTFKSTI